MSEVSEFSEYSGSNGMDKVTMIFGMQKNGVRLNEAHSVCVWTDYCQILVSAKLFGELARKKG